MEVYYENHIDCFYSWNMLPEQTLLGRRKYYKNIFESNAQPLVASPGNKLANA